MTHWFGWRGLSLYFSLCCTIPLILKRASVSVPSRNPHYRLRSLCKSVKKIPLTLSLEPFCRYYTIKPTFLMFSFPQKFMWRKACETYALPLSSYQKYDYLQKFSVVLRHRQLLQTLDFRVKTTANNSVIMSSFSTKECFCFSSEINGIS